MEVYDFVNVEERARALGCIVPTSLALLPRNFELADSRADLLHESCVPTVRTLFRASGIIETRMEAPGERFPQISEKAFQGWVGPMIFVSFALLSQNRHMLELALSVLANYITDFLKGTPAGTAARLDIVVETEQKRYKRIHYEGPVSGIEELSKVVREIAHDR